MRVGIRTQRIGQLEKLGRRNGDGDLHRKLHEQRQLAYLHEQNEIRLQCYPWGLTVYIL